ncbi:MAG: thymidine kinase [bacterium]|nr:thymidine kinase [bacterium]
MNIIKNDSGWLELIVGPMFSGKTEELIRRVRRAAIAGQSVMVFKPAIDKRYDEIKIVSHSEIHFPSQPIQNASDILTYTQNIQVIGIDEGQFLGNPLIDVVNALLEQHKRVIIAGLDLDYRGIPFEPIPFLMAMAEYVDKFLAICVRCGNPASRTQRLVAGGARVIVGAAELYEARCRNCWTNPDEIVPPDIEQKRIDLL